MGRLFEKKTEEKAVDAPKKEEADIAEPEVMLVTENQLILNELNKLSIKIEAIRLSLEKAMEQ